MFEFLPGPQIQPHREEARSAAVKDGPLVARDLAAHPGGPCNPSGYTIPEHKKAVHRPSDDTACLWKVRS
ncbi:hypothetical protein LAB1_47230 [Roseibium sp. LAB1]